MRTKLFDGQRNTAEQVAYARFSSHLAKDGIVLSGDNPKSIPPAQAYQERAAMRNVIAGIERRAKDEKRELTDSDLELMEYCAEYIGCLAQSLDIHQSYSEKQKANGDGGQWIDRQTGRKVTVLNATEKLADRQEIKFGEAGEGYSFGDIVRAMALGGGSPAVRNSLSEGVDSQGGFTVPSILLPQLIDKMRSQLTVVQAGAKTIMLDSMKTTIARLDVDPTAAWRNENATIANSDAAFSAVSFTARSLAVIVQLSMELLEDSINLSEALTRSFTGSFAVELDRVALFGTGTAPQPLGIFNTTGIGSVSMGANGAALTNFDPIIDGWQALKDGNSPDATAAIMAPRTAAKMAKLKDGQNQPMRKPDLIASLPMFASTAVPTTQTQGSSTVASSIILGDFKQLLIGVRTDLRIQLLRELYAATGQYAFLCYIRADIAVEHPASFCKVIGVL